MHGDSSVKEMVGPVTVLLLWNPGRQLQHRASVLKHSASAHHSVNTL